MAGEPPWNCAVQDSVTSWNCATNCLYPKRSGLNKDKKTSTSQWPSPLACRVSVAWVIRSCFLSETRKRECTHRGQTWRTSSQTSSKFYGCFEVHVCPFFSFWNYKHVCGSGLFATAPQLVALAASLHLTLSLSKKSPRYRKTEGLQPWVFLFFFRQKNNWFSVPPS